MANGVLIVSPTSFNRMILRQLLTSEGFKVSGTCERLESSDDLRHSLVLLDLAVSHMHDLETIARLQAAGHPHETPIIVISPSAILMRQLPHLSNTVVFTKPFELEHLFIAIRRMLPVN